LAKTRWPVKTDIQFDARQQRAMTVVLREDDFAFRLEREIARSGNAIAAR
jgi:hypothetical protein